MRSHEDLCLIANGVRKKNTITRFSFSGIGLIAHITLSTFF